MAYIGKEVLEKIKEVVKKMTENTVSFEIDSMKFLVVRDGTKESAKESADRSLIIPPQNIYGQQYLIFNT